MRIHGVTKRIARRELFAGPPIVSDEIMAPVEAAVADNMTQRSEGGQSLRQHNWLIWLGLAIGVAGFGWGAATNPSALASLWTTDSWSWLAVLAIAAVLAAIVQRASRRSELFAGLLGCVVVLAAFGISAFATVLLLLISGYALGARLLEWAQDGQPEPRWSDVFTKTTVGLSACSLLLGFAAHSQVNVPIAYLALSAVSIGLGWRHVLSAWSSIAAPADNDRQSEAPLLLRAALWFAFGMHVCFAGLPERYHDALAMHLVIPRALELFGYWHFDAREYAWAVQPMGANWLFGWAYVLAGEYAAKLLNAVFLLLICGVIIEARVVSKRLGLFAVAILVLTPLTFLETASLFVDNALTLFVVAAVIFAARIREAPAPSSVAGFAMASAGAIAVKLHGLVACGVTVLALLVFGGWRELYRYGRRTTTVCLVAAAAALWPYVYAWRATGNPVFPFFNAIFNSALFPLENFENALYPGGVSLADFFDLTFSSAKYLEGRDGAFGFAITLLLPAGLLLVAVTGSQKLRLIAFAAVTYTAIVLFNTRYLRYIYPVFPLFALVLVYPFSVVRGPYARGAMLLTALVGMAWGLVRVPAAGWILTRIDLPTAFSPQAKELLADVEVPPRKMGRIQAALGDNESRVVIFGQPVGADIRGRPIYVNWYYPKLQALVLKMSTPEDAANALAALDATHVIFDNRRLKPEWAPWHDAAERYGRLIFSTATGELYDFHAGAVPGVDIFGGPPGPWRRWEVIPSQERPVTGVNLMLPPAAATSRAAELAQLPDGVQVTLSANHVCDTPTLIRAQINWLRPDGSIIRTDATQSACGDGPERASVRAPKPEGAHAAYFYFANDGSANARLYDERATVLAKP